MGLKGKSVVLACKTFGHYTFAVLKSTRDDFSEGAYIVELGLSCKIPSVRLVRQQKTSILPSM